MRIDLHVHSNASDGTDAPAEVIRRAIEAGLDVIALTDHDTQAGIPGARAALPPAGLRLIDGMELSCQLPARSAPVSPGGHGTVPPDQQTRSVHLLAYLFDPADPAIQAETERIRDDRTYRARAMVARFQELGAPVTWDQVTEIAAGAVVGRPHLARALVAVGAVATTADAFTADWIADGGRAFVGRYAPDLARAVTLVRAAGGVPVLAHPRSPGYEVPDEVITGLVDAGLCGIEVYHADHDAEERVRLTRLARSLNLITTGGSDDHGSYLPSSHPSASRTSSAASSSAASSSAASSSAASSSAASSSAASSSAASSSAASSSVPAPSASSASSAPPDGPPPAGLGSHLTPPDDFDRLLALARPT